MLMKRALTLVAGAALALTLAACGSGSTTATSSTSAAAAVRLGRDTSEAMTSGHDVRRPMSSGAMSFRCDGSGAMAAPAALVGAGCADYAAQVPTGAGSVEGMALDPVATAASNNPLLTTLTAAVSGKVNPGVDLVNTLNNGEFTVFAPVDYGLRQDRRRHHDHPDHRLRPAQQDPDLPRRPRPAVPDRGRRHPRHRRGRHPHRHRIR